MSFTSHKSFLSFEFNLSFKGKNLPLHGMPRPEWIVTPLILIALTPVWRQQTTLEV